MVAFRDSSPVWLPCLAAVLALGCATDVSVKVARDTDFDRYRSWAWQPLPPGTDVERAEPSPLHLELARQIHRALLDRGLVYDRSAPDLYVAPQLQITRHRVIVQTTPAIQSLNSLDASASYQVQVTSSQIEIWELRQLVVVIRDARAGREVWQGRIVERHREDFGPHVGNAVAGLLSHFPMVAPAAPAIPDTQPRAVAAVDRRPADGAPRRNAGRPGD